eukprot:jgi/Orpsp1_1/1177750/evm.model.c7180000062670.1
MYRKGKTALKIISSGEMNDNQKHQVSQSVPSTPIERNINQLMLEKSAYRSLLLVDNSIKKLEKLEEEKRKYKDDDDYDCLDSFPQKSSSLQPLREAGISCCSSQPLQTQPEYIYSSPSTVKQTFAPKLRRSYSQQLKKMSKSPRLSYIQPKIQPQAQDNFSSRNTNNNRLSTISSNSVTASSTPTNYKIYKQSFQNFGNNRRSYMEGLTYN